MKRYSKRLVTILFVLLSAQLGLPAHGQTAGIYQATNNSNVRAAPTTKSKIIGSLQRDERIQVLGLAEGGSWYRVQLPGGQIGYVFAKLLRQASTAASASATASGRSPAPEAALAYFITPFDGEMIPGGKFWIRFGLRNMGIAPAGVEKQFTGHHHLLLNTDVPPLDEAIPSDDNHIHFGRGQSEYFAELPPGEHTLQLLLGDHDHIPHDPPVLSKKILITVP